MELHTFQHATNQPQQLVPVLMAERLYRIKRDTKHQCNAHKILNYHSPSELSYLLKTARALSFVNFICVLSDWNHD